MGMGASAIWRKNCGVSTSSDSMKLPWLGGAWVEPEVPVFENLGVTASRVTSIVALDGD